MTSTFGRERLSRRTLLGAAALLPLLSPSIVRAANPEFNYKFATGQDPTHPLNIRLKEAFDRIREKTSGQIEIRLFPANQLGTETDVLSQVRNGSIELLILSTSILATLVPVAGIANTAYAFGSYSDVWKALDGSLGKYIQGQIANTGIVPNGRIWDNGFRQVTSSTRDIRGPEDMVGFKIRVPPAPMLTSFFSAIGAAPTPMNFAEVYTALQTKIIEGQENGLSLIATTRLYEVQKYCALTNHSWDGYWPLANRKAWERLPANLRDLVTAELDRSAEDERKDLEARDKAMRADLTAKGMIFRDVDVGKFREVLLKTTYYKEWKAKYGDEAWGQLEAVTGKLA
ncbi:MAG: TRAP transporter substrate-binding protein [Bradyrhizobium sp.]|uniref:TRAP transporter substrate-binding protein n=1 Tax=Bradyrhizobium sp. TaxID=376 RepID=UPI0029A22FF6|nr:TRAP transporter substrate-binding protein [Bradyrhizobium sp.]MDX3969195.1 TRAP transporter substrate-binding protein [Bradyrhizobium sp.]